MTTKLVRSQLKALPLPQSKDVCDDVIPTTPDAKSQLSDRNALDKHGQGGKEMQKQPTVREDQHEVDGKRCSKVLDSDITPQPVKRHAPDPDPDSEEARLQAAR